MISKINFIHYRKLKAPLSLEFSEGINAISGLNGTCKSSILYLISNAFQKETEKVNKLGPDSGNTLRLLNSITEKINPKIETLTRGDKEYNDPAIGVKGSLYDVIYQNNLQLSFRRSNTTQNNIDRFRLLPYYKTGEKQALPYHRVIYLSLNRLLPYGEIADDITSKNHTKDLPEEYLEIFHNLMRKITRLNITESKSQSLDGVKIRSQYVTSTPGLDSNTISAGEDNIQIILKTLVVLKFYYENIVDKNKHESIQSVLLIDEIDATLHPSLQIKLMQVIKEYSSQYKIQVFFTTHSIYLLEYLFKNRDNVIYLVDHDEYVNTMPEANIHKIKLHLSEQIAPNYYSNKYIPVITEDAEARFFLRHLLGFFEHHDDNFKTVKNIFHLSEVNIGSEIITALFKDKFLDKNTFNMIGILDGDHHHEHNPSRHLLALPGKLPPEKLLFTYCLEKINDDPTFWESPKVLDTGYTKAIFKETILTDIEQIQIYINSLIQAEKSTKGVEREKNKEVFIKHEKFFSLVLHHWLNDGKNYECIRKFYKSLQISFSKVASANNIDPYLWPLDRTLNLLN